MKYTVSAGGVVIGPHNKILIIEQDDHSWSLPKGHVEAGESLLATAKREIYEESGIRELRLVKKLGRYKRPNLTDPDEMKTIYIFLFKTDEKNIKPMTPEDFDTKWVDKDKVINLLTAPKDKEFFLSILDKLDN